MSAQIECEYSGALLSHIWDSPGGVELVLAGSAGLGYRAATRQYLAQAAAVLDPTAEATVDAETVLKLYRRRAAAVLVIGGRAHARYLDFLADVLIPEEEELLLL
jgi:hypothetical protein